MIYASVQLRQSLKPRHAAPKQLLDVSHCVPQFEPEWTLFAGQASQQAL